MSGINNPSGGAASATALSIPNVSALPGLTTQSPFSQPMIPAFGFNGMNGCIVFGNVRAAMGEMSIAGTNTGNNTIAFNPSINGITTKRNFRQFNTSAVLNAQNYQRESGVGSLRKLRQSGSPFMPFTYKIRFGFSAQTVAGINFKATSRYINVLGDTATIDISGGISGLVNLFGIGKEDTDTEFYWIHNDNAGVISKTAIGITYADCLEKMYDLYISTDGTNVGGLIVDLASGNSFNYSTSSELPANDFAIAWQAVGCAGSLDATGTGYILSQVSVYDSLY